MSANCFVLCVADFEDPQSSSVMDWSAWAVCQKKTSEPLRCPLNAHGADKSAPAVKWIFPGESDSVQRTQRSASAFWAFGAATDVDELIGNHAQWHKSCHDQFNTQKLARAKKRGEIALLLQKPDAVVHANVSTSPAAFFCTKEDGLLHEFKTLGADDNVRSRARILLDSDLLTGIEGVGDLIALEAKSHLACLVGLRNRHRSLIRTGKTYRMPVNQTRKPGKSIC
ncbi:hypothetical protein GWK47_036691 [Chionoecetes opilio]|uniref:Uncharacterized protein n=1 Tax=Chionoecetes opilio TaxID=41210 RepID=A0A8J5CMY2_CHIOP|nr:hypothetical protein GWK47_036691 [Chionoecetes opilio]